jgi:predicted RNA-binding protein with PUA-like domain
VAEATRVLERGDIFFFYRPHVEEDEVNGHARIWAERQPSP